MGRENTIAGTDCGFSRSYNNLQAERSDMKPAIPLADMYPEWTESRSEIHGGARWFALHPITPEKREWLRKAARDLPDRGLPEPNGAAPSFKIVGGGRAQERNPPWRKRRTGALRRDYRRVELDVSLSRLSSMIHTLRFLSGVIGAIILGVIGNYVYAWMTGDNVLPISPCTPGRQLLLSDESFHLRFFVFEDSPTIRAIGDDVRNPDIGERIVRERFKLATFAAFLGWQA